MDGSFASTNRTMFFAARRRAMRSVSHSSSFAEWMRTTFGLYTNERFLPWCFDQ